MLKRIIKSLLALALALSCINTVSNPTKVSALEDEMSVNSEITTANIIKNPDNWYGYQSNSPDKMIDGKDSTFTWWAIDGDTYHEGNYFGFDLKEPKILGKFRLVMGDSAHAGDHFIKYDICYSDDKSDWKVYKSITQPLDEAEKITEFNFADDKITARYVVVMAKASQKNWVIIKDMMVETSLVPEIIDKSELQKKYDEFKVITGDTYTKNSFDKFTEVLNEAKTILDTPDEQLRQKQVLKVLSALVLAHSKLMNKPNSHEFPIPENLKKVNSEVIYEVYPKLQNIDYKTQSFTISGDVNLILESKLDSYTKEKARNVLKNAGISFSESDKYSTTKTNVMVGVNDSKEVVDRYFKAIVLDTDNFDKHDAYQLSISNNTIAISGKDTDASFYGLVTLEHILNQISEKNIRELMINDYADQKIRGVIEGYYGIPWGYKNRLDLMQFSAKFKNNIFIYAPKDDPLHRDQWRSTYAEYEKNHSGGQFNAAKALSEFEQLAKFGNENKNRYVYTIAPFNVHPGVERLTRNDKVERNGESRYWVIIDRLEELYKVGIRQFGILADDIEKNYYSPEIAVDLMRDLTKWSEEKGDVYDFIFVPYSYPLYNSGWGHLKGELDAYQAGFSEHIQIAFTGTDVGGKVNQAAVNKFKRGDNGVTRRDPVFWLNWPVNDIDKGHASNEANNYIKLHMGKGEMLEKGVKNLNGTFTNPMQEAHASLTSIFATDDYAWNTNSFDADKSWADGFKYIDPNASVELMEISSHMTNMAWQQMNNLEESPKFVEPIAEFNAVINKPDVDAIRQKSEVLLDLYQELIVAIDSFKEKSQYEALKQEMMPYINNLRDKAEAAKKYLEIILMATDIKHHTKDEIFNLNKEANQIYNRRFSYHVRTIGGNNPNRHAESGRKMISPNLEVLKNNANRLANNLPIAPEDKAELKNLIDQAKMINNLEGKTKKSVSAFLGALKNANRVYESGISGYNDVAEAISELKKAINNLEDNPIIKSFKDVTVDNIIVLPESKKGTWENYTLDKIIDGKDDTFAWLANNIAVNDKVGFDFFSVKHLSKFSLLMGGKNGGLDYMSEYRIRYSKDLKEWKTLGPESITQNEAKKLTELDFVNDDIYARYIVVEALRAKSNWLQISEMSVEIIPESFKVTFETNGGSKVDEQLINEGDLVREPLTPPTKANHQFGGWFVDAELNVPFNFKTTKITKETVIYAKWIVTVNKKALQAKIDEQVDLSNKTPESILAYQKALELARKTIIKDNVTQSELDDALNKLTKAINDLAIIPNPDKLVLIDNATGIEVIAPHSAFNKDVKLEIKVLENIVFNNQKAEAYDISFSLNDYKGIQPTSKVMVRIPVKTIKVEDVIVYHQKSNNVFELINHQIDGKYIVFEADHFSTYLLTNKHKPNVKPQGNNILPKTGIQNSIELIVISSGLALIGLWMMTKKYKDYNN